MYRCPRCGRDVRSAARFCSHCGAPLEGPNPGERLSKRASFPRPHIRVERTPALQARPLALTPQSGAQAFFAFRFDVLPDWLSAPDAMGQNDGEKLAWALNNWRQFVANLWKWKGCAFALRFLSRPNRGAIEAALLARVRVPGDALYAAQALAYDLHAQLVALHLEPIPIADATALDAIRRPVPMDCLLEIRQRERVVPLSLGDAYVVHPFQEPGGDLRLLFETLLHTQRPVLLSLYVEPTELTPLEQSELARAASVAQSLSDFQYEGEYYRGRWQDPQAALVGDVYSQLVQRLGQPFLCAAHVAGDDVPAAWSVARALENSVAMAPGDPDRPSGGAKRSLPVQCDVVQARTSGQMRGVQAAIVHLTLGDWNPGLATPGKERLRYLTDASGAASVVRFPIVSRGRAPGLRVKQIAPSYDQGVRRPAAGRDEIALGRYLSGGVAAIKIADLTRHGLIVGFTGSGKTNTCLHLITQLWQRHHVPVLVIEPAKTEYRGLIEQRGFESVRVFTLGDEAVSPFRLNPFELLPGVRVETHISALKTCFNAALPQFGVLPTIVEEAIIRIYRDKGWRLTDRLRPDDKRLFPTMRDMYTAVIRVAEERGYAGEVRDNIRAAAAGRIGSLLRGSKGYMFGGQHSLPMELLLDTPVILELDALNDDEKALTMMFLLVRLREYCKTNRRGSDLAHVTLIEEAHHVLENVASVAGSEVAADTRAEAVRFFSNVLAEIRAYGEAILIAEQSPGKLAPDAVRNTNLKLAHMLLDRQDREVIAGAMIMDEEQKTYLGKLPVGQAALFMTGYERATFIQVPPAKTGGYSDRLPDDVVIRHMQPFRQRYAAAYLPFDGCRFCRAPCRHREMIAPVALDRTLYADFQESLLAFDRRPDPADDERNWQEVARVCLVAASRAGYGERAEVEAAYCYFVHQIDFPFTRHMQERFIAACEQLGGM